MKGDARDRLHNLYTVVAGWATVAGILLVLAAVLSQWRVGLDRFNLVWQTLTDAIEYHEIEDRDLPVLYKICGSGHKDCVVTARFKDMQDCQSHLKRSGMLCDPDSGAGKMTCRESALPPTITTICDQ